MTAEYIERVSARAAEIEVPTQVLGTATVNAENPWPGLLAFREVDQDYFQGRRAETEDLFRLVSRERLMVFFGLSGLGKSSVLQAGLFPLLRRVNMLPVYIRLDFAAAQPDLVGQVKAAILRQAELAEIEAPASNSESLWEYLHREESDFWNRRNRPVMPVIVLDQFEEIFTLGRSSGERAKATEVFFGQLADLAEGRAPVALRTWLDDHPQEAKKFSFARHHYKILVSIREDFLPELEVLRERMPSIALNRMRLQRMNGSSALQVVAYAENLIDATVAEKVVRFVAAGRDGVPLESQEVEPALLSVVCRELNNKRRGLGEPKITEGLLEGNRGQVLTDFYTRTIGDLPVEVRNLIEERMLTVSGFRDSIALENALSMPLVTRSSIDQLVERRLLRREERGGVQRLELSHDLLIGVVRASRDRRHREEETEKARKELLAEEERKRKLLREQQKEEQRKRELRKWRWLVAVFALLMLMLFFAYFGAQRLRQQAETAADEANKQQQIAKAELDRIQDGLLIRQAALSRDNTKVEALIPKFGKNNRVEFMATATDLHYTIPDAVGHREIYRFELFPKPETLPTGQNAVAFITYLADHPTFQNTLLTAGPNRAFHVSYIGWGCLSRIVALIEYADPTQAPTVTNFNMCHLLGHSWDPAED